MGMGSDQEDPDGKRNTGHVEDESLGLSGKFGLENPTFLGSLTEVINEIGNPDLEAGHGHHGGGPKTPKMLYEPGEEKRILRNVIVISLAFTLQFTAFNSMSALQSSLNPDDLGNYSNATIYGALVISCFFLPTYLISKFTVKWTLVFSVFGYVVYMIANFKPMYETLIPAAVVVGFCAAPLWSAKCTYLTHVGHQYAGILKDKSEIIIVRFFGIFFMAFQSSQVWGNLISSLVLGGENVGEKNITFCGASFCPEHVKAGTIRDPGQVERYTLCAIFLACALAAAAVVAFFVDPLIRYGEKERSGQASQLNGLHLFLATGKHMLKPYQVLLIPLTIWSGLEQGFFASDYTQAYISCAWDVGQVGYVLICYGACDALASISFGPVVRKIGRVPVFIFGSLINAGVIVTLFQWKPDPEESAIFFVIAGLWGIGDAIWQTQINALYGVLFNQDEEPAFSNYRLWESLGFIIAFLSGNTLCVKIKLYNLSGVLALGMVGYLVVEILEWRRKRGASSSS